MHKIIEIPIYALDKSTLRVRYEKYAEALRRDVFPDIKEETFQFNKQLNCKWIRFKYTVKSANFQGKITEILYRN